MKFSILTKLLFLSLVMLAGSSVWANVPATVQIDPDQCSPLPAPGGNLINVSTVEQLRNAIDNASAGDSILLADGVYDLDGVYLRIDVPNVSVRSQSGDREAVILDGNYITTEIFQIVASDVTIADLTLREAYNHPIHVSTGTASHTLNTFLYNLHIINPGQQAIKINPSTTGYYTDYGTIACSFIELTDVGRTQIRDNCYTGGVDAHQSRGWVIRDNQIEGFWCDSGLAEHGIHFWRGCRDTLIERNVLMDNARGIGLGLVTDGSGRLYADDPCPSADGYVDDFGGIIRNNFISSNNFDLFSSQYGFDCGICLWNACNAQTLHNSIYSADPGNTFSSIEWRFPNTQAVIYNNLVNVEMRERDGALGEQSGNLTTAQANWFIDASNGDLHLRSTAVEAIDQVSIPVGVSDDIDGEIRPIGMAPDVGADEYGDPPPVAVTDLRVTQALTSTQVITITLGWSPPTGALSQTIRYAHVPITAANWDHATLLTNDLTGNASSYTFAIPYSQGTHYFAQKSYNIEGGWSALSNNAYWPSFEIYLSIILH
ncbi:MAG: hypothetical protein ACK2U1_19585 [Anaerolineales bacterium]